MKQLKSLVIEFSLNESEYSSFKEIINKITNNKNGFKVSNLNSDELEIFNNLKDEICCLICQSL